MTYCYEECLLFALFKLLGHVQVSRKGREEVLERYTQYPSLIFKTRPWNFKTFSCNDFIYRWIERWLIVFYLFDSVKFNFIITGENKIMFLSYGSNKFVVDAKLMANEMRD